MTFFSVVYGNRASAMIWIAQTLYSKVESLLFSDLENARTQVLVLLWTKRDGLFFMRSLLR